MVTTTDQIAALMIFAHLVDSVVIRPVTDVRRNIMYDGSLHSPSLRDKEISQTATRTTISSQRETSADGFGSANRILARQGITRTGPRRSELISIVPEQDGQQLYPDLQGEHYTSFTVRYGEPPADDSSEDFMQYSSNSHGVDPVQSGKVESSYTGSTTAQSGYVTVGTGYTIVPVSVYTPPSQSQSQSAPVYSFPTEQNLTASITDEEPETDSMELTRQLHSSQSRKRLLNGRTRTPARVTEHHRNSCQSQLNVDEVNSTAQSRQ